MVGVEPTGAAAGTVGHPSAPLPVVRGSLADALQVPLGESGLRAFPLVLGAAEFGWTLDTATAHAILDTYRGLGGNIVHTSDSYSGGRSEHIVGRWLARGGIRDSMVLAVRIGRHPDHPGLGSVNLVRAVEASLNRLDTDRIDLLYLDASGGLASLEDALATAEWLIESGKVRALGAYGFTATQLVDARILSSAGYPRVTVLDVPFNVVRRADFTEDLRLVTGAQAIAVTPSHALEHGFLAGRPSAEEVRSVRDAQRTASTSRRTVRAVRAMRQVAGALGAPLAAVAVAWLLAQRQVAAPIVNAFAVSHVEELVQGVGVRLSRAQLADIARAYEQRVRLSRAGSGAPGVDGAGTR
jgi:aryl-alcohol dehydrogenase-like predicted oxidoreductase